MTYDEEMRARMSKALWPDDRAICAIKSGELRALLAEIDRLSRPVDADVEREAAFLVARIGDLDWCDMSEDGFVRDWNGHVDPALSRLRAALAAHPHPDRSAEVAFKAALDRISNTQRETFASPDEHGLWCKRTAVAALASLSEPSK